MAIPTGIALSPTGATETWLSAGIALVLQPADPTYDFLVTRATDTGFSLNVVTFTVPAEDVVHWDALPYSGTTYYYRAQHVGKGGEPNSAVTLTASGTPQLLTTQARKRLEQLTVEARRRGDTLYGADGQLAGGTTVAEGTSGKSVVRNRQNGTARHGDTITFQIPYQNAPFVNVWGGLNVQPVAGSWTGTFSSAVATYDEAFAQNVTATTCTIVAQLRQRGTLTARTKDFQNVTRTAVGDTDALTTTAGASANDTYTLKWNASVSVTADPGGGLGPATSASASLTVAIDSWDGVSWTERYTRSYTVSAANGATGTTSPTGETATLSVTGITATSQFRLRIKAASATGDVAASSVSLHGWVTGTDGGAGLTYQQSTGDATASKTPATSDFVYWEAGEYVG